MPAARKAHVSSLSCLFDDLSGVSFAANTVCPVNDKYKGYTKASYDNRENLLGDRFSSRIVVYVLIQGYIGLCFILIGELITREYYIGSAIHRITLVPEGSNKHEMKCTWCR